MPLHAERMLFQLCRNEQPSSLLNGSLKFQLARTFAFQHRHFCPDIQQPRTALAPLRPEEVSEPRSALVVTTPEMNIHRKHLVAFVSRIGCTTDSYLDK
jgi:hypothetical protein